MLIFSWLLHLLLKIDAATFEVIVTNYCQNNHKETVSMTIDGTPHKQTSLCDTYAEEKY